MGKRRRDRLLKQNKTSLRCPECKTDLFVIQRGREDRQTIACVNGHENNWQECAMQGIYSEAAQKHISELVDRFSRAKQTVTVMNRLRKMAKRPILTDDEESRLLDGAPFDLNTLEVWKRKPSDFGLIGSAL